MPFDKASDSLRAASQALHDLATNRFFCYNANVSSAVLTAKDVAQEVERLAAESGFGHVQVVVANGRIERIDRCVQIKAAAKAVRPRALEGSAERN